MSFPNPELLIRIGSRFMQCTYGFLYHIVNRHILTAIRYLFVNLINAKKVFKKFEG